MNLFSGQTDDYHGSNKFDRYPEKYSSSSRLPNLYLDKFPGYTHSPFNDRLPTTDPRYPMDRYPLLDRYHIDRYPVNDRYPSNHQYQISSRYPTMDEKYPFISVRYPINEYKPMRGKPFPGLIHRYPVLTSMDAGRYPSTGTGSRFSSVMTDDRHLLRPSVMLDRNPIRPDDTLDRYQVLGHDYNKAPDRYTSNEK